MYLIVTAYLRIQNIRKVVKVFQKGISGNSDLVVEIDFINEKYKLKAVHRK